MGSSQRAREAWRRRYSIRNLVRSGPKLGLETTRRRGTAREAESGTVKLPKGPRGRVSCRPGQWANPDKAAILFSEERFSL